MAAAPLLNGCNVTLLLDMTSVVEALVPSACLSNSVFDTKTATNFDLALPSPVIWIRNQTCTHGILENVVPFLAAAFAITNQMIE